MVVESRVEMIESAFWTHRGPVPRMSQPHRHDDLELNLVVEGRLEYHWAGGRVTVEAGSIALFWGATPHRLVDTPQVRAAEAAWVHLPLAVVLRWGLPDSDVAAVLDSRPIIVSTRAAGQDISTMIDRWTVDVDGDEETVRLAMLEAEALVRRLLRAARGRALTEPEHPLDDGSHHAAEMARYLAGRFRDPISPADIVDVVHLHPRYAMTLFRRFTGMTVGAYLIRCRIAEAQRLLITSTMTTSEVALAAGFGSQSSLYAHFGRETGMSPGRYRRTH